MTDPPQTSNMYHCTVDDAVMAIRRYSGVTPSLWRGRLLYVEPLGESSTAPRHATVAYARDADGHIWFVANVTFHSPARPGYTHRIDNVEDFETMLQDPYIHDGDRNLYRIWLDDGLRETLLNA